MTSLMACGTGGSADVDPVECDAAPPSACPDAVAAAAGEKSNEDDDAGLSYFEEYDTCMALLRRVTSLLMQDEQPWRAAYEDNLLPGIGQDPHGVAAMLEVQFAKIIDRYQESPDLLYPHLEALMQPLVNLVLHYLPSASSIWQAEEQRRGDDDSKPARAAGCVVDTDLYDADASKTPFHLVCRALYTLVKTAGEKACTSYFPHDVRYYEDVFYALRRWRDDPRRRREWEVRYCLLLWLSNLVLVPFALSLIDTNAPAEGVAGATGPARTTLSDAVLQTAIAFLAESSKCREGAALLLARMLTRPDSETYRAAFLAYTQAILSRREGGEGLVAPPCSAAAQAQVQRWLAHDTSGSGGSSGSSSSSGAPPSTRVTGVLFALAKVLKLGRREELVRYAAPLIPAITELYQRHGTDMLLCKLLVKVGQRLLLTLLRSSGASWRYRRQLTRLDDNLAHAGAQGQTSGDDPAGQSAEGAEDEDGVAALPEADYAALEAGLGLLLDGLAHKDTVVRWSAAKGVGRVCERLPRALSGDVVAAVLAVFDDVTSDSAWHGGLLALAELCRRGVVQLDTLAHVVFCVTRGLQFDLSKGTYSVGAHVRDAACYTCWSIARAYDAAVLEAHVQRLACGLVTTALLDREINVRRAAAAAFQECVGRLGNFANGIDLVTTLDFYSLASMRHAYTVVAVRVGRYAEYRPALLTELLQRKLVHWDRAVRRCAAVALGRLVPLDPDPLLYLHHSASNRDAKDDSGQTREAARKDGAALDIFATLMTRVTATAVAPRHGAVLALAELVRHVPTACWAAAHRVALAEVIPRLGSAGIFRERGGEYMREAGCGLLQACAARQLALPETIYVVRAVTGARVKARPLARWQEFLEDTLGNILEWLQQTAAATFAAVAQAYYSEAADSSSNSSDTAVMSSFRLKVVQTMLRHCGRAQAPLERRGFLAALGGLPPLLLQLPCSAADCAADGLLCATLGLRAAEAASCACYAEAAVRVLCEAVAHSEDPESRRNAVQSLAAVVTSLPPHVWAESEAKAQSYGAALHALLAALQDYAVDKRGDVGSFVRLAALRVLPRLVQHGLQQCQTDAARQGDRSAAGCTQTCLLLWLRGEGGHSGPDFVVHALQDTVRLAMEKSDRVRAAACGALIALLLSGDNDDEGATQWTRLVDVLAARTNGDAEDKSHGNEETEVDIDAAVLVAEVARLRDMLRALQVSMSSAEADDAPPPPLAPATSDDAVREAAAVVGRRAESSEWGSPALVLPRLAPGLLQDCPAVFALCTMQGLVLAAGDVSSHVREPAVQALMQAFRPAQPSGGAESEAARRTRLSRYVVEVATRYTHCERVLVPLSRVADTLLNAEALCPTVHASLVALLRLEMKHYAGTIVVLLPLTTLLANLCRSACAAARQAAWSLALVLVASRFPKVRAKMATDLYTALLLLTTTGSEAQPQRETGGDLVDTAGCQRAMTHLLQVQWDGGDVAKVRAARDALYDMLGVARPAKKGNGAAAAAAGDGAQDDEAALQAEQRKRATKAVAASYKYLVQEAGY